MSINFSGIKFNFGRKEKTHLSSADFAFFNSQTTSKILEKPVGFYQQKLNDINFCGALNMVEEALDRFNKDGIFIIKDFLSQADAETLSAKIELESNKYLALLNESNSFENQKALIQRNSGVVKGYDRLSNYQRTVFDIRSGIVDCGMVDIFNIDKYFYESPLSSIFESIRKDVFLIRFLEMLPRPLSMKNINAYLNSGVTSTRGFHVDTYTKKIKIFIYLTDVLDFSQGPYTYVRGSHVDSTYRKVNRIVSSKYVNGTEAPFVPCDEIYPILAPKGSLVLSDQSGFHRGFPQSKDSSRLLLSINCI